LDVERFYFLGSGLHYGLACEAMLKMTEMSLSSSQAFHSLEFRHGPMSMVDERVLVAGLFSRPSYSQEVKVLDEMAALGANTLALMPLAAGSGATYEVHLAYHLPTWALPVLYLPPLQLLAYHRAVSKGLDPDKPRNLQAVIYLDRANFP
jgi:glucosamine--fructose-6-phosphate aminotransferase (isomerizing)